jgi:hypothetical protein
MENAVTGVLHGTTVTLDAPLPRLDGRRVRVFIEPVIEEPDPSAAENAELLRQWAARGPQGPIDDEEDFPDDL